MNKSHITTADILKKAEEDQASGDFKRDILTKGSAYQASKTKPGMIEQVHADGSVLIGHFENRQFIPEGKNQGD